MNNERLFVVQVDLESAILIGQQYQGQIGKRNSRLQGQYLCPLAKVDTTVKKSHNQD